MRLFPIPFMLGLAVLAGSIIGCAERSAPSGREASSTAAGANSNDGSGQSGHVHPSEGPHDGDLIELGSEEYHAELLHDPEAGTVTMYILNGSADEQISIEAREITINAKHEGRPAQFKLEASPDTNDAPGQSSRFISNDKDLATLLDEHAAEPRLVLAIKGKSYRGLISHDHDHE